MKTHVGCSFCAKPVQWSPGDPVRWICTAECYLRWFAFFWSVRVAA